VRATLQGLRATFGPWATGWEPLMYWYPCITYNITYEYTSTVFHALAWWIDLMFVAWWKQTG